MKVKELINKLKECDEDFEVQIWDKESGWMTIGEIIELKEHKLVGIDWQD